MAPSIQKLIQVKKVELPKPDNGEKVGPAGVAVSTDTKEIAIADIVNGRVLMFTKEGGFLRELGRPGQGNGELNQPFGVAFTADGKLLVTEELNHRVQLFDNSSGDSLCSFGKEGTGDAEFKNPTGVSVDSDGRIIVCDFNNCRVQVFNNENRFLFKFGDTGDEKPFLPYSCVFHKGKFFVTDNANHCIKVFDEEGEFLDKFGEKGTEDGNLEGPCGLVESDGKLVVCNRGNGGTNCIQILTLDGQFVGKSDQPIPGNYQVAKFPDAGGTIFIVTALHENYEGCFYLLR